MPDSLQTPASPTAATGKADYGQDVPRLTYGLLIGGAAVCAVGVGLVVASNVAAAKVAGITVAISGFWPGLTGLLMILSSRFGKLRARDRLLDRLALRGDETVLDVGCGRGLLLIGAARLLPRGKAVGIDLWSSVDLGDNRREATLANARAEGVADRVKVHDGDMRELPFADGTFDAVVASFSIHNVYDRAGRRQAIGQIVRVLKPGGRVALMDMRHVREYADDLAAAGMIGVHVTRLTFVTFPPSRTAMATRRD